MKSCIRESEETKSKILHAAKEEFAAKGFSGARMSSIAAIAGVNQALLHYHFTGKENIYKAVIQKLIEDISKIYGERIISEVESWNVTPDIKLCAAIYVFVNSGTYIGDAEFQKIMAFEIAEGNGILHEYIREYMMPQLSSVSDIINEGISLGIFQISNVTLLTINMLSFIWDISHAEEFFKSTVLYEEIYGNKYEDLYNFMIELSFKALRPDGKKSAVPVLDESKKNRLNSILEEMRDDIKNF
jgi:AcrR family transcriptional regulator